MDERKLGNKGAGKTNSGGRIRQKKTTYGRQETATCPSERETLAPVSF